MKKLTQRLLCVGMALVMVLSLAACGNAAPTDAHKGTWELTNVDHIIHDGMNLILTKSSNIALFSDNTFVLTDVVILLYSSDGGETYSPLVYKNMNAHGKCEVIEENKELNETTIKITEITSFAVDGIDSTEMEMSAEEKELYVTNNASVGLEIILGADGKMSETVDMENFVNLWGDFGS